MLKLLQSSECSVSSNSHVSNYTVYASFQNMFDFELEAPQHSQEENPCRRLCASRGLETLVTNASRLLPKDYFAHTCFWMVSPVDSDSLSDALGDNHCAFHLDVVNTEAGNLVSLFCYIGEEQESSEIVASMIRWAAEQEMPLEGKPIRLTVHFPKSCAPTKLSEDLEREHLVKRWFSDGAVPCILIRLVHPKITSKT
jgi:hypothetical protein